MLPQFGGRAHQLSILSLVLSCRWRDLGKRRVVLQSELVLVVGWCRQPNAGRLRCEGWMMAVKWMIIQGTVQIIHPGCMMAVDDEHTKMKRSDDFPPTWRVPFLSSQHHPSLHLSLLAKVWPRQPQAETAILANIVIFHL